MSDSTPRGQCPTPSNEPAPVLPFILDALAMAPGVKDVIRGAAQHIINNKVSAINGYSTLMCITDLPAATRDHYASQIRRAALEMRSEVFAILGAL